MTKAKWIVGTNMPGYMPDSDPAEFTNWLAAHKALVSELALDIDSFWQEEAPVCSGADLVDMEQTLGRAKTVRPFSEFGETVNNRHYWLLRA